MRKRAVSFAVLVVSALAAFFLVRAIMRPASSDRENAGDARFLTLGALARELAKDEKTFDAIIDKLGTNVAPIDGAQRALLKKLFQAHDYQALDSQPETSLDTLAQGLTLLADSRKDAPPPPPMKRERGKQPLGIPTSTRAPDGDPFIKDVGLGLLYGDRIADEKRARFGDSERLAAVLDGLALKELVVEHAGKSFDDALALVTQLKAEGHAIVVLDQRLAANFGDIERNGKAIATPLWIQTGAGALTLPVPHAQLLLSIRGPTVNADVTLYPALDLAGDGSGGTRFRSDLTSDQPWCGGVEANRYEGEGALAAVKWMAELRRFVDARVKEKSLPLDGYFALGVCTLAPALVEQALTGKTTLWPLTHDPALFDGDTDVDKMARALPHDGRGAPPPDVARLRGSVPWPTPASIPFAHTRAQLAALGLLAESGRGN